MACGGRRLDGVAVELVLRRGEHFDCRRRRPQPLPEDLPTELDRFRLIFKRTFRAKLALELFPVQRHPMVKAVLAEIDQLRVLSLQRQHVFRTLLAELRRDDLVAHRDADSREALRKDLELVREFADVVVADEIAGSFAATAIVSPCRRPRELTPRWRLRRSLGLPPSDRTLTRHAEACVQVRGQHIRASVGVDHVIVVAGVFDDAEVGREWTPYFRCRHPVAGVRTLKQDERLRDRRGPIVEVCVGKVAQRRRLGDLARYCQRNLVPGDPRSALANTGDQPANA